MIIFFSSKLQQKIKKTQPPSQSACTILVLKTWVGLWTWKKVQNMGCKKQGAKKQGHCYSKREEAAWSFLFLNYNDPVFLHPAFFRSIFCTWFFSQTNPCFQNKNSGCRLTGRVCCTKCTEGSRLIRISLLRISLLRFFKKIHLPYANLCLMLWAILFY